LHAPQSDLNQHPVGDDPFRAPVMLSARAEGMQRKHFKTEGENRFNFETYTGIGYGANVLVSLAAVYWAERTTMGQALLKSLGHGFEKLGFRHETGEFLGRKSFFLTGGFAVVPFMKWLEDDKFARVKKYNREIYGTQADTDPTIIQSEREVAEAPKQSWASICTGRILALIPFYATVGLLWDRTSKLGLMTNPQLNAMGKEARIAMRTHQPEAYAQRASKGMYFDRPISSFSRDIGKLVSSRGTYFDTPQAGAEGLTKFYHGCMRALGKLLRFLPQNPTAITQIERMEAKSPGMMQSVKSGDYDPIQAALPYYAISEAITSAMVAWGLFVITRVTGPFFDKQPHEAPAGMQQANLRELHPVQAVAASHPAMPGTTIAASSVMADKLQAQPAMATDLNL